MVKGKGEDWFWEQWLIEWEQEQGAMRNKLRTLGGGGGCD